MNSTATSIGNRVVEREKQSLIEEWRRAGEQTDYAVDVFYVNGLLSSHFGAICFGTTVPEESFRFPRTAHEDVADCSASCKAFF